jgi:hypothetical protein
MTQRCPGAVVERDKVKVSGFPFCRVRQGVSKLREHAARWRGAAANTTYGATGTINVRTARPPSCER